jgi:hypothetical protein
MKNVDCIGCHQLGQESTRTIPAALGQFKSGEPAWVRRIQSGQYGEQMTNRIAKQLGGVPYRYFGDWTDRIAKGELPFSHPRRPQGLERNIVISWWEWSTPDKYLHDLISSDRRYPTVNAYGPLYGSPEYSTDLMPILDPRTHQVTFFKMPVRDPKMPLSLGPGHAASVDVAAPSPYWGDRQLWDTRANNHNAMFDEKGRLWLAASVRGRPNPDFCKKGSSHPSAKVLPLEFSSRQLAVLDPKTKRYTFVDTCFGTHHLQFGYDANNTLWVSGSGPVAGWLDVKMFDETGDAARSQGWSPFILDANGNSQRDDYTGAMPASRQGHAHYCGISPLPSCEPGGRLDLVYRRRAPAPAACCGSIRRPASGNLPCPMPGFSPAAAISTAGASFGVIWQPSRRLTAAGAKGRERPKATGDHCRGWAFISIRDRFQGIGRTVPGRLPPFRPARRSGAQQMSRFRLQTCRTAWCVRAAA